MPRIGPSQRRRAKRRKIFRRDYPQLSDLVAQLEQPFINELASRLQPGQLMCCRQYNGPQLPLRNVSLLCWDKPVNREIVMAVLRYFWEPQEMAEQEPNTYDQLTAYFDNQPYNVLEPHIYVADLNALFELGLD